MKRIANTCGPPTRTGRSSCIPDSARLAFPAGEEVRGQMRTAVDDHHPISLGACVPEGEPYMTRTRCQGSVGPQIVARSARCTSLAEHRLDLGDQWFFMTPCILIHSTSLLVRLAVFAVRGNTANLPCDNKNIHRDKENNSLHRLDQIIWSYLLAPVKIFICTIGTLRTI